MAEQDTGSATDQRFVGFIQKSFQNDKGERCWWIDRIEGRDPMVQVYLNQKTVEKFIKPEELATDTRISFEEFDPRYDRDGNIIPGKENLTRREATKVRLAPEQAPAQAKAATPKAEAPAKASVKRLVVYSLQGEQDGVVTVHGNNFGFSIRCFDEQGKPANEEIFFTSTIPVSLFDYDDKLIRGNTKKLKLTVPKDGSLLLVKSKALSSVQICFLHSAAEPVTKTLRFGVR